MQENPWEQAYNPDQDRVEQIQGEMGQSGIASLAGYMLASAIGPAALKGGFRRLAGRIGSTTKSAGVLARVERIVERRDGITRGSRGYEAAMQRRMGSTLRPMQRVQAAAAAGLQDATGAANIDLSRFASRIGIKAPERLRRAGANYRQFKKSDAVKQKGYLKALSQSKSQRRLLSSGVSEFVRQQAVQLPVMYGLDTYTGLSGMDLDQPAIYDIPGHVKNMANYIPKYLGFEAAGRVATKIPGLAKMAARQMKGRLGNNPKTAQVISKAYQGAERFMNKSQKVGAEIRDRHTQRVASSTSPINAAFGQAKEMATNARSRSRVRSSGDSVANDASILGARDMFSAGTHRDALVASVTNIKQSGDDGFVKHLFSNLFVDSGGEKSRGYLGELFNAKSVSLREIEGRLSNDSRKMTDAVKAGVNNFRQRVMSQSGNMSPDIQKTIANMDPGQLRVSGYLNINGQIMRMPTSGDLRNMAGRIANRATTMYVPGSRGGVSLFEMFNLHTVTSPRPAARVLDGGVSIDQDNRAQLFYFGKPSGAVPVNAQTRDFGFEVADRPGSASGRVYGTKLSGSGGIRDLTQGKSQLFVSGGQGSKMLRIQMRQHLDEEPISSEQFNVRQASSPNAFSEFLRDKLQLGAGISNSAYQNARNFLGKHTPRNLFGKNSPVYTLDPNRTRATEGQPLADSMFALRQAMSNSNAVYTNPQLFGKAMENLFPSSQQLGSFGSIDEILLDPDKTVGMTRYVLDNITPHLQQGNASPTTARARAIMSEVNMHPDNLHNTRGDARVQVLRRFLFEQGALGTSGPGQSIVPQLQGQIDNLMSSGAIASEAGLQGQAGLTFLQIQDQFGGSIKNPYTYLNPPQGRPNQSLSAQKNGLFDTASQVLRSPGQRAILEKFAASRPRLDLDFHRKGYLEADTFSTEFKQENFFATNPSIRGTADLFIQSGLDTTRDALSYIGLGWNQNSRPPEVLKTWGRRAGAFAALSLGYRITDASLDIGVPDGLPFDDGLSGELADLSAGARITSAKMFDAVGVTAAAQYLEGLMPKSVSTIPGAALGYFAGGWKGAVAGAVFNRATVETLKDTPLEGLAILPPFAPFVSDLTKDSELVQGEMSGDVMVPIRKGRGFILSSGDFAGGRITQFRPNWYTQIKADVKSSPVLYGSRFEQLIHEDLPFIDFSIGDLFDPQYLQKKHYYDRPYVTPDIPFSDVPLLGPQLGRFLGRAYNAIHPLGSNASMHMEEVQQTFDPGMSDYNPEGQLIGPSYINGTYANTAVGNPLTGVSTFGSNGGVMQDSRMGPAYVGNGTILGADSSRASYDEQFYRLTEALGFTGFATQQLMGGEGVFRDSLYESATRMDSTARSLHDQEYGDLLGIGEGLRRLYPFERNADRYGPRNTMPGWMPEELQFGDPYCLTPETLIEVNETLITAEEAYHKIRNEENLSYATTHKGRLKPFLGTQERMVEDHDVYTIVLEGLPHNLRVTGEHPILVVSDGDLEWKFAWDITTEDTLVSPVGPSHEKVVTNHYKPGVKQKNRWTLPHDAVTTKAIMSMANIQPSSSHSKYMTHGMSPEDIFNVDKAFKLSGSKYTQREKVAVTALRRVMFKHGLPSTMVGMSIAALTPIVQEWGELTQDGVEVTVRPEDLGLMQKPEWTTHLPVTALTDMGQALTDAVHTLYKAFAAAGTPARITGINTLLLGGNNGAVYFLTEQQRRKAKIKSIPGVTLNTLKFKDKKQTYEFIPVNILSVFSEKYTGPVYAFEVMDDATFVAAGVTTHNSKVALGEALLPGSGYELLNPGDVADRELSVSEIGADAYETSMRMLGIVTDQHPRSHSWAKQQVTQRLIDSGVALRANAVFVDESTRVVGVADAVTRNNSPIHIQALSDSDFRSAVRPRDLDLERINTMLGAASRARGMMAYVNSDTGELRTFVQNFDSGLYNSSVQKLQEARTMAREYSAQGFGAPGAMYSTVDRLQVLMNAQPFGDEWRVENRKAKALYKSGAMAPREANKYRSLLEMRNQMSLPFEVYQQRFGMGQLMDPSDTYTNLTYNDNIQAASEYSLPERMAGSIWETATNLRSPLHTKFFGNYTLENQYERMVLLQRDFQSWDSPVDDFVKPYISGLLASEDPLQGALSYGMGGLTFGGPAFGMLSAGLGVVYGAVNGAYRGGTSTTYIPQEIEEQREAAQAFDRIKYYRAKRLYDATGSQQFLDEMQRSSYGWTQQGLSRTGWAKERRHGAAPTNRLESPLYAQDMGFGSPWRGLRAIREGIKGFSDITIKHKGDVLTLGKGTTMGSSMSGKAAPSIITSKSVTVKTKQDLMVHKTGAPFDKRRPVALDYQDIRRRAMGVAAHGMSHQGVSSEMRRMNTQVGGNMGFGSPWRGQDSIYDVGYDPMQVSQDPFPPELLTAFGAIPSAERDFLRAGLLLSDKDSQDSFMRLVSPDMASMLDVGWNYMYGQELRNMPMNPMQGLDMGLSDHPIMGMGAYSEGYQIKTIEALGLDVRDANLGWKRQMMVMNGSLVQQESVASMMNGNMPQRDAARPADIQAIITTALAQMGIIAQIDVSVTSGPTEIHIHQTL